MVKSWRSSLKATASYPASSVLMRWQANKLISMSSASHSNRRQSSIRVLSIAREPTSNCSSAQKVKAAREESLD